MISSHCRFCLTITLIAASGSTATPGWSQIVPDSSINSVVSPQGNTLQIDGGTTAGTNLFHSFQDFSVPTGTAAFFNNPLQIENIITRVTGSKISNIDGIIRANGTANLFLLNPNGLSFGPNASLNIGGSFIGSTAESVVFADGIKFSATNPNITPLLTVSVPIGLQLAADAGPIQIQGQPANNFFSRFQRLAIAPHQTFALVGSQIDFNSVSLSAPDGRIELWAVRNAQLAMDNQAGWHLTSPAATADWGTITLRQSSNIDATGTFSPTGIIDPAQINGGFINIQGRGLTLQDGSGISSISGPFGQGPGINVKTTEFVNLLGVSSPENYATPGLFTSVFGDGARAGDITIETGRLQITNGAWLQSIITFGNQAKTGNITVRASDVDVIGYNPFGNPATGAFPASAITTLVAFGNQNESGNIHIEAQKVRMISGGRISADLLGSTFPGFEFTTTGSSGDIEIKASESIEIAGVTPDGFTAGVVSSIQPAANGIGGNITIDTQQLKISQGGSISSATAGNGIAGTININASQVQVSDPFIDSISKTLSGISASVGETGSGQGGNIILNADSLRVFNGGQITSSTLGNGNAGNVHLRVNNLEVEGTSPPFADGNRLKSSITAASTTSANAGSVTLTANTLTLRNQGEMTVSNTGGGSTGDLQINTNRLQLDRGGSLRAEVTAGTQGNIDLKVNDILLMRNGSQINTNATGTATGGNIIINAPVMAGLENSDIAANAIQGAGGNIQISTQGIFGLEFRPQPTSGSDITASSQFGVSGNVRITNPDVQPNAALVELPANLIDPNQKIAQGCEVASENRFIATGRGGLPPNPTQRLEVEEHPWTDVRDLSAFRRVGTQAAMSSSTTSRLVEANAWQLNRQGQVEIYVSESKAPSFFNPTCAGTQLTSL
jgi:filamentous hemagglutinin family protein